MYGNASREDRVSSDGDSREGFESLQQDHGTYCRATHDHRDLFLTLRTEDLDQLSELIERARSKADSLHAFTAAADLREIN